MVSNSLEALQRQPVISKRALKRLQQMLKTLTQQVTLVEAELLTLLEQRFAAQMTLLCSITGIGRKTAGMLLLFTGGFTHFDSYRQVIALAGLSSREHNSGTSIRGKVRITKMGGGLIRGKLFMCSFSAKKTNAACAALFDRLVAKGKNKKLALIAVCNKLLKQVCTIIKSGVPCQADFNSKLACTSWLLTQFMYNLTDAKLDVLPNVRVYALDVIDEQQFLAAKAQMADDEYLRMMQKNFALV